ncbi:MAG TPA: type II secretion system F family protein [Oligoflexia bacterium]|nr:type II secretion system F family protein [Oligoflexia bacterium]HMP48281.1 type II secretion system F family protein [Oligoflexia bacterium]
MLVSLHEYRKTRGRRSGIERLRTLRDKYSSEVVVKEDLLTEDHFYVPYFSLLAERAGYGSGGLRILFSCFILSLLGIGLSYLIHPALIIVILPLCFYLPIYFAEKASRMRSQLFSEEYPTLLLATASNMKAGLTVYAALDRAVWLLPPDSEVKAEVGRFLEQVGRGVPKEIAVRDFARTIVLPELELFRRAFELVLSHGGKFSRTLERLAEVCRERESLIKSSRVSTASMRMTANVLLGATPIIIGMLSLRNKDYWEILFTNRNASMLGVVGVVIIVSSYLVLRRMSDFKP